MKKPKELKGKDAPRPSRRKKDVSPQPVPVVGIGASAGGLEAFRALLEALPTNSGMAYVLVQHLDPRHESMLSELLARATHIPVVEVKRRTVIRPDHVYVIPPGKNMALKDDALVLSPRSHVRGTINMPIDHLFRSLAETCKEQAVGVVLSGTASDGTNGLRAIKEAGGLTFVQNNTAKYQGMPQAAISAGVADYVLPPHGIAKELVAVTAHPLHGAQRAHEEDALHERGAYEQVVAELLRVTGVDFGHYKATTLTRRIMRRMLVNKAATPHEYLTYLRGNDKEADALFNDILIHVTGFFRDPVALNTLSHKVLPRLAEQKANKEPYRIWVAGCSTGEEVYSLAITLLEFFGDEEVLPQIQLFGTDLSLHAIEKARHAVYSRSDVANISPRRLEKFFVNVSGSYQIRKHVRDLCVFSVHNLVKDPPFSRMDIVSCCNVLIYMDAVLQRKIFSAFHYALAPYGALVVGKSETVGAATEGFFSQVEKKSKVFVKKDIAHIRGSQSALRTDTVAPVPDVRKRRRHSIMHEPDVQGEADALLLSQYVPACVLVNESYEIMQFRGETQGYLRHRAGKAGLNVLKIVREELASDLRDALLKAKRLGTRMTKEVLLHKKKQVEKVVLEVIPLNFASEMDHFLVIFETAPQESLHPAHLAVSQSSTDSKKATLDQYRIERLERELTAARENARSIAEENEGAVEELQAANEEVLSSNEELQSINEELETSTEELESTNEELNTVNQELQTRNEELTESKDYSESIIATMRNPLLVLDRDLRVKTANQSFCRTFRTIKEDTEGQYLYELGNGQWDIPELRTLLSELLPKNNVVYDYAIEHTFPLIGRRIFHLNAHILDQKSHRRLILLAFEDVTEAKELNRQKDEFIGIASHEIKTPITTIKTFTELLRKKLSAGAEKEYANILDHIVSQSDRLTTLVTDLLSFSQIQAGQFVLRKERFDLDKLIERTASALQESAQDRTIEVVGTAPSKVYADPSRTEQVLINLLTNAIKYSPEGKKVVIRVEPRGKEVVVSVQDLGGGIPADEQKTIFDRFHRGRDVELSERHTASKGFGLGLYICAQIIEKHHGAIWVDSTPGKGSTFSFTLPLAEKAVSKRTSRS